MRANKMNRIDFFKSLNFSDYEAKTLSSLSKLGVASTKEISFDSGVPQNKLYAIFEKFKSEGIIANVPSSSKKFKLINFKNFIYKKINEKEEETKKLKSIAKNFENVSDEKEFGFVLIKGQKEVMNKLSEKNLEMKKEIFGVQRNWQVWGDGLRKMAKSVKSGVDIRMIGIIDDKTKSRASEWKKIGCKVKNYNKKFGEYPLRFTVFDGCEARITLGKPEVSEPKDYITIWTKSKPLINILRKQFLDMWRECEKF